MALVSLAPDPVGQQPPAPPPSPTALTNPQRAVQAADELRSLRRFEKLVLEQLKRVRGQIIVYEDFLRTESERRRARERETDTIQRTPVALRPEGGGVQRRMGAAGSTPTRAGIASQARLRAHRRHTRQTTRRIASAGEIRRPQSPQQMEGQCAVCLETVQQDLGKVTISCNHEFHQTCIDPWLAMNFDNPTCPVCRDRVFIPAP